MTGPCSKLFLSAVREARDDNKRRNHIAASTTSLSQSLIITEENGKNFELHSPNNTNNNSQNNKNTKSSYKKNHNKIKPRYHGSMDSLNTDGGGNKTNNQCILPLPLLQMASSNQQGTTTNSPFPSAANFPRTPQILIDPNTGQQYIIPAPQPQIYYQPVYIPAQTAQPNQGQQIFFTPSQNGQMQPQPFILSTQTTSGGGYLYTPRSTNQGSNVSTPVMGQHNEVQQSFTCDAFSRLSNNSNGNNKDNSDSQLSSRSNPGNLLTTTFAQMKISQQNRKKGSMEHLPQSSPLMDDSKNVPRPTLNWNSPKREGNNGMGSDSPKTTPTSPTKYLSKRTPFHGNNFIENEIKNKNIKEEINEPTTPVSIQKPIRIDFDFNKIEEKEEKKEQNKTPVCRVPPTAFTISFDDDESNANEGSINKKSKPKNLQEARMKKLNSMRNENLQGVNQKINNKKGNKNDSDNASTTSEDPKRYLLTKLLQGSSGKTAAKMISNNLVSSSGNKSIGSIGKGEDTLSDAGTYVVSNDNKKEMSMSKVIDSDDDDSIHRSESEYNCNFNEEDEDGYRSPSPISNFRKQNAKSYSNESSSGKSHTSDGTIKSRNIYSYDNDNKQKCASVTSISSSKYQQQNSQNNSTSKVKKESQIGTKNNSSTNGTPTKQSSKSGNGKPNNTPSVIVKQTVASMARQAMNHSIVENNKDNRSRGISSTTGTSNTSNNFRRADGGRFSMRGSATPTGTQKPPFKTGVASARGSSTASPRESNEFAAWLRRKDYNPMKAAAEAKKMKELKSRTDSYVSTRSISFHHGATTSKDSNLIGDKNNISSRFSTSNSKLVNKMSSKDNDIMMASMDSINENDIDEIHGERKMEILPSPFTSTQSLHLSKAVDELTFKCQKSIQLIKLFSGQGLSESMENLIEEVISPDSISKDEKRMEEEEDLGHRLENLNVAFDAIQKCLEGFHKEMRIGSPMVSRRSNISNDHNSETTTSSQYQDKRNNIEQSRHSLTSLGSSEDSEKITY
uniref:Uncharacterized protein n=1 Tax=Strongyloides stercoralis TaxID=6248 RepID=A0AAF5D8B5_STRER